MLILQSLSYAVCFNNVAIPRPTLPSSLIKLYEGVDRDDILDNRSRPRIFRAILGWKMNRGQFNRCSMAVAGDPFEF